MDNQPEEDDDDKVDEVFPDARGADLEGDDLEGLGVGGADVQGAEFEGADVEGDDLEGLGVGGADVQGAEFEGADVEGGDLEGLGVRGADVQGAEFEGADVEGDDLEGLGVGGADVQGAEFEGADVEGGDLEGLGVRGADVQGAEFEGVNVEGPHLHDGEGGDVEGDKLVGSDVEFGDAEGVDVEGSNVDTEKLGEVAIEDFDVEVVHIQKSSNVEVNAPRKRTTGKQRLEQLQSQQVHSAGDAVLGVGSHGGPGSGAAGQSVGHAPTHAGSSFGTAMSTVGPVDLHSTTAKQGVRPAEVSSGAGEQGVGPADVPSGAGEQGVGPADVPSEAGDQGVGPPDGVEVSFKARSGTIWVLLHLSIAYRMGNYDLDFMELLMGKKGSWFSAVKKVFSPDSKNDKRKKNNHKSKKQSSHNDSELASEEAPVSVAPPVLPPLEDVKLTDAENEQNKHAFSLAFATVVAAEAAAAAAHAAAEVVRLTRMPHYHGKTIEEIAAIKIQTAFRGYMARRALRALRGLVRLKTLTQKQFVRRQATSTLRCMQTLARLQSQIRERRIRMSEENQALQRQLQQKHEKELEKLRAAQVGEEWNDSLQSKEQIEAKLLHRQEAALRRERALAYSFSHQQTWKNSSKSLNPTFMDPNNLHWGWSWLERWMAARPWESQSSMDHNVQIMSAGDQNNDKKPSPLVQKARRSSILNSPSTQASKTAFSNGKGRTSSSKGSAWGCDDDSRSMFSVQSERYRRHSIGGSSVRDDESLASSPAIPSYMASTSSAMAKSKIPRPSPEKGGAAVSAKKRLSFSPSPAGSRRHSGPPKVEMVSNKDVATITNGGGW
ncbi:hypothetical protein VNO77_34496 [Canavalia gladiata]|uniref:Uncharacterized protein n=1 Tax=Canavalia gladiata TaxID=3824 RepID=A0AAN9KF79_CANGL